MHKIIPKEQFLKDKDEYKITKEYKEWKQERLQTEKEEHIRLLRDTITRAVGEYDDQTYESKLPLSLLAYTVNIESDMPDVYAGLISAGYSVRTIEGRIIID